jgi:hypothetical protein
MTDDDDEFAAFVRENSRPLADLLRSKRRRSEEPLGNYQHAVHVAVLDDVLTRRELTDDPP